MTKTTFFSNKSVTFNPERKGAKYTFDGVHYFNNGNYLEGTCSECYTGVWCYDTKSVAYDKGSDIEQIHASVKSSKASLTDLIKGDSVTEVLDVYFERCPSKLWIWAVKVDEEFWFYEMNASEFRTFTLEWAGLEHGKVRYKTSSGKMIKWLEERL